jgi:hypothetical protein
MHSKKDKTASSPDPAVLNNDQACPCDRCRPATLSFNPGPPSPASTGPLSLSASTLDLSLSLSFNSAKLSTTRSAGGMHSWPGPLHTAHSRPRAFLQYIADCTWQTLLPIRYKAGYHSASGIGPGPLHTAHGRLQARSGRNACRLLELKYIISSDSSVTFQ